MPSFQSYSCIKVKYVFLQSTIEMVLMVEGNLKNTIEKLKALKTEAAQQATEAAVENEKVTTSENKILASIKELEDSLPPVIGTVTDSKAFRVEELTYLKIKWFLYFDKKNKNPLY